MRPNDKKIFSNKHTLYEMVQLRRRYATYKTLSLLLGCHESSIRAQCHKLNIEPIEPEFFSIHEIIAKVFPVYQKETQWITRDGERINKGRSYKEYLTYPSRNRQGMF